jgi:hypothetical protein
MYWSFGCITECNAIHKSGDISTFMVDGGGSQPKGPYHQRTGGKLGLPAAFYRIIKCQNANAETEEDTQEDIYIENISLIENRRMICGETYLHKMYSNHRASQLNNDMYHKACKECINTHREYT